MTLSLSVDPLRLETHNGQTGVLVRAMVNGSWAECDAACLDRTSLLAWLRSRGGVNEFAENFIGELLGHGRLTGPVPGRRAGV